YKPVDRKVRPVLTMLPEHAHPKWCFPEDPLLTLPSISKQLPSITGFGTRLMQERWEALGIQQRGFLLDKEVKLVFEVLIKNETALTWDDMEKGQFQEDYFDPITVPTIEHEPWSLKNIPIP
ncbi:hypothetical protein K439DRAFT_1312531, partial [Ramaria rubella]